MYQLKQFLFGAALALVLLCFLFAIPTSAWLPSLILLITFFLTIQGFLVTRSMLYGFSHRESPVAKLHPPSTTFSLIVPARNEASVIGETIRSLSSLHYPQNLYEVLIMIRADDYETILAAQQAIKQTQSPNIRIIKIDGDANNKAYSLNIGLQFAEYSVIGIFDAEDEPHPDILTKINDYFSSHRDVGAVQAPVHLTNLNSSWYASLNAVEYYYWFRSVLPYLATYHIVPLGGNTIFTRKKVFDQIGVYDETCLTEDADIGIRLAANQIKVAVLDDIHIATREETPGDELGVIRQRSRWDQGYLQVLDKGNWATLNLSQQFYAIYTLTQPLFRHLSFLNMVFAPLLASFGHIPLWVALISFIPGYFLILQLGLYLLGLADLAHLHHVKVSAWRYVCTLLAFIPYQALLALATLRAIVKLTLGNYGWDKTQHTNSHRPSLAILEA